jgi:deoxyribonuclease IV
MPPKLGAHVSAAGGMNLAIDRGRALGCDAIQVFTKSPSQWKAKPLDPEDVKLFKQKAKDGPWPAMSHGSYLINSGTPNEEMYAKSVAGLKDEVGRCDTLAIPYLVFHPGGHMGSGPAAGTKRAAAAIDAALSENPKGKTVVCIENMAGAGTLLGGTFEELAAIRDGVPNKSRVGVCFDTCHAFAAGIGFGDAQKYGEMWDRFDEVVGLEALKCFQFNDSMFEFALKKDRHQHIGKGYLGLEAFRLIVNDPRFDGFPMVLETDPEDDESSGWKKDLAELRKLLGRKEPIKAKRKGQVTLG